MTIAVITAFFPQVIKQPIENCLPLLKNCKEHMFIYTTKEHAHILSFHRGANPTTLVIDDFPNRFLSPYDAHFSEEKLKVLAQKRRERFGNLEQNQEISSDFFKLYLSKAWFVERSITSDSSFTYYVWCDIGSCITPLNSENVSTWPSRFQLHLKFVNDERLVFYQRRKYTEEESQSLSTLDFNSIVSGSHIFGKKTSWQGVVNDIIARVTENLQYYGDGIYDETVYFTLVQHQPEKYRMIFIGEELNPQQSVKTYEIDHEKVKPILLICGCKKYKTSLENSFIRFKSPFWTTIGLIGQTEKETYASIENDNTILYVNAIDTYENLPQKIFRAFSWCNQMFPNSPGIFKTDDDILISDMEEFTKTLLLHMNISYWGFHIDNLEKTILMSNKRIQERFTNKNSDQKIEIPPAHYCWGHGYWVSKQAFKTIANYSEQFDKHGCEDVIMGNALNAYKIYPVVKPLNYKEVERGSILQIKPTNVEESIQFDTNLKPARKNLTAYIISLPERFNRWQKTKPLWEKYFDTIIRVNGIRSPVRHAGCGLAHISAIRLGLANEKNPVIVLEDDVVPSESLTREKLVTLIQHADTFQDLYDSIYLLPMCEQVIKMRKTESEMFLDFEPTEFLFCNGFMIYSPRCTRFLNTYEHHLLTNKDVVPIDRILTGNTGCGYYWKRPTSWLSSEHLSNILNLGSDNGGDGNFAKNPIYLKNRQLISLSSKLLLSKPRSGHSLDTLEILRGSRPNNTWLKDSDDSIKEYEEKWKTVGKENDYGSIHVDCVLRYGLENSWIMKEFHKGTTVCFNNQTFEGNPINKLKIVQKFN